MTKQIEDSPIKTAFVPVAVSGLVLYKSITLRLPASEAEEMERHSKTIRLPNDKHIVSLVTPKDG